VRLRAELATEEARSGLKSAWPLPPFCKIEQRLCGLRTQSASGRRRQARPDKRSNSGDLHNIRTVTTYSSAAPVSATARCCELSPPVTASARVAKRHRVDARTTRRRERLDFFRQSPVEARSTRGIRGAHHACKRASGAAATRARRRLTPAGRPCARTPPHRNRSTPSRRRISVAGRLTPLLEPIAAYARGKFSGGAAVLEAALDLMRPRPRDFAYIGSDPNHGRRSPRFSRAAARLPGFRHIMIAALRGLGFRPTTSAAICARCRLRSKRSKARTPRTPGSRSGAARPSAGFNSTPPTICFVCAIISCWPSDAITPTFRRSMAY